MIRTIILGADTPDAGELIRILSMHPDIELVCTQANRLEGIPLTSHHHGLIGETELAFTSICRPKKCDVIIDFSAHGEPHLMKQLAMQFPESKLIRLDRCTPPDLDVEWVFGLPEINRKTLVRGARAAVVPTPFASMALVALYPLALNLLLKGDITLNVEAPESITMDTDILHTQKEIRDALQTAQKSFDGDIKLNIQQSTTRRAASMKTEIPCTLLLDDVKEMFDMYNDHHFAFAVASHVGFSEVAGTDKCVVSLSKPEMGTLQIGSVVDCRMRGGAGEAVHILNLLCGLHERTGLALKAIDFHPI